MDFKTFPTKASAQYEIAQMQGWPEARPVWVYMPDDKNATPKGNVCVVECEPGKYLRTDGFVR